MRPAFLLATMIAVTVWALPLPAAEVFESNAAGIALSPIEESQRDAYEYVLEVVTEDGVRERVLYRDGEEDTRERFRLDERGRVVEEERYEDGVLREGRRYDERGLVREILEYDDTGLLERRIEADYADGRRVAERHYNPEEELLFTDTYQYGSSGRVARVTRRREGEVVRTTSYAYAGERLFEEAYRRGEELTVVRYDTAGRVSYRAERREGELLREEEYRYEADGARVVTTRAPASGEVTVERYQNGQLVSTRVEVDGEPVRRTLRDYDEEGNLVRVTTEGEDIAGSRVERYEYDEEGELARRIVELRGTIVREVVYSGERTREEITYRDGEPFLRVTYRDDNPVSRELVDGE